MCQKEWRNNKNNLCIIL